MTVTIVALTRVNEDHLDDLSTYMATTAPLMENAGALVVSRLPVSNTVVGSTSPAFITLVEYPDGAAVSTVFDSAEYGLLKEVRARAFSTYEVFTLGEDQEPNLNLLSLDLDKSPKTQIV